MLAVYERLTKEGKIGPFDAEGRPRPYQEFPKQVKDAGGNLRIVLSAREELAVAADTSVQPSLAGDDALLAERNRLADENESLRLQLAALAGAPVSSPAPPAKPIAAVLLPAPISPKAPVSSKKEEPTDGK